MAPYYEQALPAIKAAGCVPFVDTDGDITIAADWFERVGMEGILPLERMAGVDVAQLRRDHPDIRMLGAFDKTVMNQGEAAMREEFERLLPVAKQGGFIIGCDHQTPPGVSLDDYRLYVKLFNEYARQV
jgi:uroporphyrinogen-III decarboxylase